MIVGEGLPLPKITIRELRGSSNQGTVCLDRSKFSSVPKRHRRWRESENLRNFERFARKKQNALAAKRRHLQSKIGILPAVLLRKTTGSRPRNPPQNATKKAPPNGGGERRGSSISSRKRLEINSCQVKLGNFPAGSRPAASTKKHPLD